MPRGTADPQRPLRIALAAIEVVADRGVEGLTHRAVAATAGIPLGSTTDHFKTLDDLLAAAIVEAKKATDIDIAAWAAKLGPDVDLADAVTDYVMYGLTDHWGRLVVEHELYLAALRRPQLRSLAQEWDQAFVVALSGRTDAVTAEAIALVVDGVFIRAVIHGMPARDEVEALLRRIID